jgi:parvulin-like peptidyl-prolyl isomerase
MIVKIKKMLVHKLGLIKPLSKRVWAAKRKFSLLVLILLIPAGVLLGFFFAQIKDKAVDTFGKTFFAATVNGYPVTKGELEKELKSKYSKQALDELVNMQIINNYMREQGVSVSDDELNQRIAEVTKDLQGQSLEEALKAQGVTVDEFRKNISYQVGLEKVFSKDVTVTEEEVTKYFDTFKDTLPGTTDDEKKTAARKQAIEQKLNEKIGEWFQKAKQDAKIKTYL